MEGCSLPFGPIGSKSTSKGVKSSGLREPTHRP